MNKFLLKCLLTGLGLGLLGAAITGYMWHTILMRFLDPFQESPQNVPQQLFDTKN